MRCASPLAAGVAGALRKRVLEGNETVGTHLLVARRHKAGNVSLQDVHVVAGLRQAEITAAGNLRQPVYDNRRVRCLHLLPGGRRFASRRAYRQF
jgi:hypothetical protein